MKSEPKRNNLHGNIVIGYMSAARGSRICKVPFATVLAILMTGLFALYSVFPAAAVTPSGVQCPTAPVQQVNVASINCCGKLVCTKRAPRPGDKGFVQCRCAEKGASQQKATSQTKVQVLFGNEVVVEQLSAIPDFRRSYTFEQTYCSIDSSPSILPPNQAWDRAA
ncbi:MAG TPA: hypothetical protein VGL56_04170 [Fimbriimonadaceae bacterium]